MSYVIENHLPVPERGNKGKSVYPFAELDVGDHFFVDDRAHKAVQAAASNAQKAHKAKYVVRPYVKSGVQGSMVWRDA